MTAEEKLLELLEIQDKLDRVIKERNQLMDNADVDVSGAYPKPIFNQYEQKTLNELCKEEVDLTRKKDNFIKTHNVDNDFALVKEEYKRLRAPIDELEIKAEQIEEHDRKMRIANDDVIESNALTSGLFFSAAAVMVTSIIYAIKFGIFNPIATFVISILIAVSLIFCIVIGCQNLKKLKYKRRSKRESNQHNFFKKSNYDKWKKISEEKYSIIANNLSRLKHLESTIELYERALGKKDEDSILHRNNRTPKFSTVYSEKTKQKSDSFATISFAVSIVTLLIAFIIILVFVGIAGAYNSISMSFVWTSAAFISIAIAIALAFTLPLTATKKEEKGATFIVSLIGGFLIPLIPAAILVIIIAVVVQAFTGDAVVEKFNQEQIEALEITTVERNYVETFNLTEEGTVYWEFYGKLHEWSMSNSNDSKAEAQDIIEISVEKEERSYNQQPARVTWSDGTTTAEASTSFGGVYGTEISAKVTTQNASQIKMLIAGYSYQMTVCDQNGNVLESATFIKLETSTITMFTFDLSDYKENEITITFESSNPEDLKLLINAIAVS